MLLWPFNKYPGTDYETFNWEWLIKTVKTYTAKVNEFTADITDAWDTFKNLINHEIAEMHRKFAIYVNVTAEALNSGAIADGAITEPKINTTFLKTIKNAYVTPEMYGAAGDGVTDDTEAIRQAANNTDGLPVVFGAGKTYIINIEPGTATHDRRVFFDEPKTHMLIGDNSTIKLGTDNGNITAYKGFESIFRWFEDDEIVYIYGLTFDYNNIDNPVIHTEWTPGGTNVEMNSQQLAISAYFSKGLIVSNCRFIDYAGTNVINYRHNNAYDGFATIKYCEFKGGNAAKYNGANVYHDHSTISIHKDSRSAATVSKMTATVSNNIFEGLDGVAYNPCECSADEFLYYQNIILNYEIGVLLLTKGNDNIQKVFNNIIKGVGTGIAIFGQFVDNGYAGGFHEIDIDSNFISLDIYRSITTPSYNKNINQNGFHLGPEHHAIGNSSFWYEIVKFLNINNNVVEYENSGQVPADAYTTQYDGTAIGFTYSQTSSTRPYTEHIDISNNKFYKIAGKLFWDVATYVTKTLKISDNMIFEPWSREGLTAATINGGLIQKLEKNGEAYVENTFIQNNTVIYPYDNTVYGSVWLFTAGAFGNGNNVIANQNISKKPYYGGIHNTDNSTTVVENSVWIP